jgi:RimJ/RimL family protein N-acetyltransferase
MNALVATELELLGRAVWLRPFEAADLTDTYVDWLNDPQAVRYSNQRFVRHSRESCARHLASFRGGPNQFFSLRLQSDDRAIGSMTAHRAPNHGTADVGIFVGDTSVWGQGHGQDAWDTLLAWLLQQPGMRKVTASTLECNLGMRRLAEGSGMQLEGVRRDQELVDSRPWAILHYARFADVRVNGARQAGARMKNDARSAGDSSKEARVSGVVRRA